LDVSPGRVFGMHTSAGPQCPAPKRPTTLMFPDRGHSSVGQILDKPEFRARARMAINYNLWPGRRRASEPQQNQGFQQTVPGGFLARGIVRVKLYAQSCVMTNRHFLSSLPRCTIMLLSAAGKSHWRSRTSAPAQAYGQSAKSYSRRPAGANSNRIIVWRLDRWGRSLLDLISTLQELASVNVGFVSLTEALVA
jgi:hypothetical protein